MRDIRRIIRGKKALRDRLEIAERNGIDIVGTYIDRAYSARTDNRPDFQKMIKDSATGKYDVVIVAEIEAAGLSSDLTASLGPT